MVNGTLEMPKVKIPQQARSREKYEAMVRAAEKLFGEQGIQDTSVQDIVTEAGVSIGAFYQRFENKEAIIYTIFNMLEEEMVPVGGAVEQLSGASLQETLKLLISLALKASRARRSVLVAMIMEVERNPNMREYVSHLRNKMGAIYAKVLAQHADEITHSNIKRASTMANRILYAYITQALLYDGHEATEKALSYKVSDKELVNVLRAYLTQP